MGQGASECVTPAASGRMGGWVTRTMVRAASRAAQTRRGAIAGADATLRPLGATLAPGRRDGRWSVLAARSCCSEVVLIVVAYLAGSIPFGVIVARLTGGARSADHRLRPDRRHERAAGAGPKLGGGRGARRSRQGRACRCWSRAVVSGGDPSVEVLCGRPRSSARSGRSSWVPRRPRRGTGVGTMLVIQPLAVILAAPVFIVVILRHALRVAGVAARVGRDVPGDAARAGRSRPARSRRPTCSTRSSGRRSSGSPTPTTSTGCCTARSASSTSGCWAAEAARAAQ